MIPARIKLSDGSTIPQVGLGLWQITDAAKFRTAFDVAIKAGYRHFDTAQIYKNEQLLGECLEKCKVPRRNIFVTTKIYPVNFGYQKTLDSFNESLTKLRTDYVDLLLLHMPAPKKKSSWRALERLKADGKVRSIGVSNYQVRHLKSMKKYATTMPSVNQIEMHVFLPQPELVNFCKQQDIVVEAYSPLARGKFLNDPVLKKIAGEHGRSPAAIMLRWCIEQGFVLVPKSMTPARIKENINIFDFELTPDDLNVLTTVDGHRVLKGLNLLP